MKVSKVATIWIDYHKAHSKKNTVRSYKPIIDQFCLDLGDFEIDQISPDDILRFLNRFTEGNKPYNKRIRYSPICSFFNFIRNNMDHTGWLESSCARMICAGIQQPTPHDQGYPEQAIMATETVAFLHGNALEKNMNSKLISGAHPKGRNHARCHADHDPKTA